MYVSVCVMGKDKAVASVGDQSFCHKGSDSGFIAWERNRKERIPKEKQELKLPSFHFKWCVCFFTDALC